MRHTRRRADLAQTLTDYAFRSYMEKISGIPKIKDLNLPEDDLVSSVSWTDLQRELTHIILICT